MFRADQHSYLLYPNRELPRFLDRNNLSPALVKRSCLLRKLVNDGDMKHVRFGHRIYITRDQINDFLHANTHAGYVGRW